LMLSDGSALPNVLELLPHRYPFLLLDRVRVIDRLRYRGAARPGDEIQLDIELLRFRRGILRTRGEARVDGRRIVRAELTTVLRAAP
ncbi:MAG: 3-hydroxyacyl-ACP dehydratase FabZ family protein, partial [Gemmatimonadaceae bacterium]